MPEHAWTWTTRIKLPSRYNAHIPCMQQILDTLKEHGWDGRDLFGVEMALEESLSNAIRHGNCCDESKIVDVDCRLSSERFWIQIVDQGSGFKPDLVPDCTEDENLECPGGRGLALMKAFMTTVEYNDRGNCITLEKIRTIGTN